VKYIPNILSVFRILLVIPTVEFLWQHEYGKALAVFFIAGISDGLDGFLARRFGWVTRLGSFLDPMGDKLLMTASYFTLGLMEHLPVWLVVLVIGRDLLIVFGALAYRLLVKEITMQHLLISKINTGAQILLVILIIFHLSDYPFASHVSTQVISALIYLVAFTTLASGLAYVVIWSTRAHKEIKLKS
jgi:cardiolipin synthase